MNQTFTHYGSDHYNPDLVKPIKNLSWRPTKPVGGFWVSPIRCRYSWYWFCTNEDYHTDRIPKSFKIKFKDDAKIFKINRIGDIKKLPLIKIKGGQHICFLPAVYYETKYIDWEKASKIYDAIWLNNISVLSEFPSPLYGWDVISVLIFNKNSIYECKN
jgi:hypothetical protein